MLHAMLYLALATRLEPMWPLQVDFHVAGAPSSQKGRAPAPTVLTPVSQSASDEPTPAADAPARIHFFTASGFGHAVALAFALRQIVPAAVHLTIVAGVDAKQPVDWQGGRPWDKVLRTAIAPTGLHVQMAYMAVKIVP